MTRDRDIERVLDRFYAEGPSEMPDRVFLGVFDRIERIPQRRLAHLSRFATMSQGFRLAAAAIVVALVGVGAFAWSQFSDVGPLATPGASATIEPSPSTFESTSVPVALRSRWVGTPRVVAAAPEPPDRVGLEISPLDLQFKLVGGAASFDSVAALVAPDRIRLSLGTSDGGCQPQDEGFYAFTLTAGDTVLTLDPVSDTCAARAALLSGDWIRAACPNRNGWCLGDLQAGDHVSTIFTPFVPQEDWTYSYGRFGFTVPAGWTSVEDCPWCYVLAQQEAPANTNINLWSGAVAHVQVDQCSGGEEPGVGRTADAIVTWLASLRGLVTTEPTAVTIGGLHGKMIDLSVSPSWTASCSYAYQPNLPLVSTFTDTTADHGFDWNIQGEGRTRIIALDLGDGRALVIDIEAQNKADYDALLPEAMEVVNSFTFNR